MQEWLQKTVDDQIFQNLIIFVIVSAAILIGLETYPYMQRSFGSRIDTLHHIILWIFAVEILMRVGAHGSKPWQFFVDPWNVFDFAVVVVCFLPFDGNFVAVLRLTRLLRVLRLVTALPRLRLLVGALLKSIPSIGYVALLLVLLFYIYAVMGTSLFGQNDPVRFGSLHDSMLTLFAVSTLEGWTDVMYTQMYGSQEFGYEGEKHKIIASSSQPIVAVIFFVTFILIATMIILNLFIGVIMNGMEEMKVEEQQLALENAMGPEGPQHAVKNQIVVLEARLAELQQHLLQLKRHL